MLRTARHHLRAQVEGDVDTNAATVDEARDALVAVDAELAELETEARADPELAYLFHKKGRQTAPRRVSLADKATTKEDDVARKSNAAQLEEVLVELRKAEKSAGSTKWALSGKGAEKNPPSKERKAHLTAKLETEQAKVAELRAKRDELKAKAK